MADGAEDLSTDQQIRRSAGRTLRRTLAVALLGIGLGAWGWFGLFQIEPGQAAVILLMGSHHETIDRDGIHWRLPPPLMLRTIVNVSEVRNEDFGFRGRESADTPLTEVLEATMQTGDNNVVRVSFAVQYTIKDAFLASYRVAEPRLIVRDAAQAAMREVVGRMTVDEVLREKRALVASEVPRLLQDVLDSYEAGLLVEGVQLQGVEPPAPVRAAFDDVMKANQDANRLVNEAEGYRNEVLPKARAEGAEKVAAAEGYRDARLAEAEGEAARFEALHAEYAKAPQVMRTRLYLEALESVLPGVEKVIVEPGTAPLLPYLPRSRTGAESKP